MARFKHDGENFDIQFEDVFVSKNGELVEDGVMVEVGLLSPTNEYDPIPVVDNDGKVCQFPNKEVARKEAMKFIIKNWEQSKPKPRLPVGTKVYVASRNAVGRVAEENIASKYFRVTFQDGTTVDIHEKDLTPVRF